MRLVASPRRRRALAGLAATALLTGGLQLLAAPALATVPVVRGSTPGANETVSSYIGPVQVFFTSALAPLGSSITVTGSEGDAVEGCTGTPTDSDVDGSTLSCQPRRSLAQDVYTVRWTAQSSEPAFETRSGAFAFTVDSGPTSVISTTPRDGAIVMAATSASARFVERIADSSTITLTRGGNQLGGVVTVDNGPEGVVTFTPTGGGNLPDGVYDALATAVDTAGNQTPVAFRFTVDGTAPAAPTLSVPPRTQRLLPATGTGEPGALVTVTARQGGPLPPATTTSATATVSLQGEYATTLDLDAFAEGPLTVDAVQRDAAGGTSAPATATSSKDSSAPAMPTVVVEPVLIGASRENSVVVTGEAEAGSTVTLRVEEDGNRTGRVGPFTTTAAGGGTYRFEGVDVSSLEDGALEFFVQSVDAAQNRSMEGLRVVQKDTEGPAVERLATDRPLYSQAESGAVTVTGSTQAGSTVVVVLSDSTGRSATSTVALAPTATAFSTTFNASTFADGTLTAAATATDRAGNVGPTATTTAVKDGTPPPAPTQEQGDVTVANETSYRVTGVTEPGATVTVTLDDRDDPLMRTPSVTLAVLAGPDGRYDAGPLDTSALADGLLDVRAVATDPAGNTAARTEVRTKDTVAPEPVATVTITPDPVVRQPNGAVEATVSGRLSNSAVVSGEDLVVSVTLSDGRGGTQTLPATPDATGAYTVTFGVNGFADGPITATATVVDSVGNRSTPLSDTAEKNTVTLARTATTPTDGADVRSARRVSATYTEPLDRAAGRSTVVVTDRSGSALAGTVTFADDDRTIVFTPAGGGSLSAAGSPYTATFSVRDRGVEQSTTSIRFTVTPDAPPTVTATNPVNAENDEAFRVSGTTEPGARITVTVTDAASKTVDLETVADSAGAYAFTGVDVSELADGPLVVTARAVFTDGVASRTGSTTVQKDTRGPALVATSPAAGGTVPTFRDVTATFDEELGDLATATVTVRATGERVPGVVSCTDGCRTLIFTRSGDAPVASGVYDVAVAVSDQVGNRSGAAFSFTVDADAPAPPVVTAPETVNAAQAETYTVGLSGLEPGAAVTVTVSDGSATRTVTTSGGPDGTAQVVLDVRTLRDGTLVVRAVQTDGPGNASAAGTASSRKDTVAPTAPTVDLPARVSSADERNVLVTGVGEPGATVTVTISDSASQTVVLALPVDERGEYAGRADVSRLADGELTAVATATDAAGNASGPSAPDTTTKDTAAPAAPSVVLTDPVTAANAATATVTGRAEPGTVLLAVTVDDEDPATPAVTGTATPQDDGTYALVVDLRGLSDGTLTATVTATDAAGNTGAVGTGTARKDTRGPVQTGASPATGTVGLAPAEVRLSFDSDLGATATVTVRSDSGTVVTGSTRVDGRDVVFTPDAALPAGSYDVTASVTDGVGNPGSGATAFTVTPPATSPSPSPSPAGSVSPSPEVSVSPSPQTSVSPSPSMSPSASVSPVSRTGSGYVGLPSPRRVLDTRANAGRPRRGQVTLDLSSQITDPLATAAVLNVTVTGATARGFLVAYPAGTTKPGTSNVNFEAARAAVGTSPATASTQANEVVVRLPADRRVVLFVENASAHVIADLVGSFTRRATSGLVSTRTPDRVLDTRTSSQPLRRGTVLVDLAGRVPTSATAAVLNVTVTRTTGRGFAVVYPAGTTKPGTSNVNFEKAQTRANEVTTQLGTGANRGKVLISVEQSSAAVVVDLVGVVTPAAVQGSQAFTALQTPLRAIDTRLNGGAPRGGNVTVRMPNGVPTGATGVVLNVTATGGTLPGFLTVFPFGQANPGTSNVNFTAARAASGGLPASSGTTANEVIGALGSNRSVTVSVGGNSGPRVHVIVDVVGYLTPQG